VRAREIAFFIRIEKEAETVETGREKRDNINSPLLSSRLTRVLCSVYYFAVAPQSRVSFGFGTLANENTKRRSATRRNNERYRFNRI